MLYFIGCQNVELVYFTAMNADTPYSAALALMDVFFIKEELSKSHVMTSKKSFARRSYERTNWYVYQSTATSHT